MKFTEKSIVIVGDSMLDRYIRGTATRLSPEAPVPVVKLSPASESLHLGGAGNVAANICALGGNPILISVLGQDQDAIDFERTLQSADIHTYGLVHTDDRKTTVKTRIIANGHQIARVDAENTDPVTGDSRQRLIRNIRKAASSAAAIVISDYAKGVVTIDLMEAIGTIAWEFNLPVFVDPKVAHKDFYRFGYITAMTPNMDEAHGLAGISSRSVEQVGLAILDTYGHNYALITRGEYGMTLHESLPGKMYDCQFIVSVAKQVFDVSGAGDTVIAALALAYASGYDMQGAARIANRAAGVVVGKPGTAVATLNEILEQ